MWLLLATILIFVMFENPIAFFISSIILYAIYLRLSLLFKNINIKIYSNRINIAGKDYLVEKITYKERSGTRTTTIIGEFHYDNQRIEQFIVSAEFCSRITSFDGEKLNQYLQLSKDGKEIHKKFDFTKEIEEGEYYHTVTVWVMLLFLSIIGIILTIIILSHG